MDSIKAENKLLIFLHIPKTAGTTLISILTRQYSKFVSLKEGTARNIQEALKNNRRAERIHDAGCVRAHFAFGAHQWISRPSTYMTMLRNPIEQAISTFYHIRRRESHPLYPVTNSMTFEGFVNSGEISRYELFQNVQTRYVSGEKEPNLEKAIKNLDVYFSVVGITERFDESLFVMSKEFGWKNVNYKKKNVAHNRPSSDQIPKEVINKIAKYNELDLELYRYGLQLLDKKLMVYNDLKSN